MNFGIKRTVAGTVAFLVISLVLWNIIHIYQSRETFANTKREVFHFALDITANELREFTAVQFKLWKEVLSQQDILNFLDQSNAEFEKLKDVDSTLRDRDTEWIEGNRELIDSVLNNKVSIMLKHVVKNELLRRGEASVSEVFITNRYGANVASTNLTTDYVQSDENWWQRAMADSSYLDPEVSFDESANVQSLILSFRLANLANEFIGIAKIVINLESIGDIVSHRAVVIDRLTESDVVLVSNSGKVIFYPRDSAPWLVEDVESHKTHNIEWLENLSLPGEYENEDMLMFRVAVSQPGDAVVLPWSVVAIVSKQKMFRSVEEDFRRSMYYLGGIVSLVVLAFVIMLRYVEVSFQKLCGAAGEIAAGNFKARTKIKGASEVGQLGQAFDTMANHIESLMHANEEATEALKRENLRRQNIVKAARLIEWEYDCKLKQLRFSQIWHEDLQSNVNSTEEDSSESFLDSIFEEDRKEFLKVVAAKSGEEGDFHELSIRIKDSNNETRWFIVRGRRSATIHGQSYGILYDNTIQHHLKGRLMRRRKLETIGKLSAGIAHEINTPLQYMQSQCAFLDTYSKKVEDVWRQLEEATTIDVVDGKTLSSISTNSKIVRYIQKVPEALNDLAEGITSIGSIVSTLKATSDFEGGLKCETHLNQLIEQACAITHGEWGKVAEIELDLDPSIPLIEAYPTELYEVFLQVLINSAEALINKYSATQSKGVIKVVTQFDAVKRVLHVEITDSGPGIETDSLDKVFDPFFTTKDVGDGAGMGLTSSYSIVTNRHGGTIWAESAPGTGTSIFITLPLRE